MNIAIIVRKLNIMGGTQREALSCAREMKHRGHEVTLYTFLYSKERCYSRLLDGFRVVSLNYYPRHSNFFLQMVAENRAAKKLALLIDNTTEALNPHDQASYRVAYYFKKKKKNIPSVWMMNDMPTRYVSSYIIAKELDPRLYVSWIKRLFYRLVDGYEIKKFIRAQDKIVVLDTRDRDWVREYYKKDAVIIRNGIDIAQFSPIQRKSITPKNVRLLCAGIFLPHRRFEDAIEAVRALHEKGYEVHLSIAGDGASRPEYYEKIIRLVSDLSLENHVSFLGRISEERWQSVFAENDIFIFPNHMQSWGIVVFEAMASGMPVIVSKTAGASEVLTDGENGILVNPKAPHEIADGVMRLVDVPGLYENINKNSRTFVENNISWRRYTEEMLSVIASCYERSREKQK